MNILAKSSGFRIIKQSNLPTFPHLRDVEQLRVLITKPTPSPHHKNRARVRIRYSDIQNIHKRMVWFQKLTRNLFLTLHGHNLRLQQRQLSKFLTHY
jgi:hypothetical protein